MDRPTSGIFERVLVRPDASVVRICIRRADPDVHPCGYRYTFRYSQLGGSADTLPDGTICEFHNAAESVNGHERRHVKGTATDSLAFPGLLELYEQFWVTIDAPIETAHDPRQPPATADAATAVLAVDRSDSWYAAARSEVATLQEGGTVSPVLLITCPDGDTLDDLFPARVWRVFEAVRDDEPGSLRATARVVGRDASNVRDELRRLETVGLITTEADGRAERPVPRVRDVVVQPVRQPVATDT